VRGEARLNAARTGSPRSPFLDREMKGLGGSRITSALPTTRPESRTRFALCRSAVYVQQSRARLTLLDLATENREFTWVDLVRPP
jgi:hypothetical protein